MQTASEPKDSTAIEQEYELLKKRLYSQFFKGFLAFLLILQSNEAVRVFMYSNPEDIFPFVISLVLIGLGIIFANVMEKYKERIMTIFFFGHYLAMFFRLYKGEYGYKSDPVDAYYVSSNIALYEGIICARIPRLDYQILFSVATLAVRIYLIRPNNLAPILFHTFLIAAKIFLENHREVHNKHLFQIYINSKEQLVKFKNLVVHDFPQGIAILHKNLTKYLFINDLFKSLNEDYNTDICSQLEKFVLKQKADGAESEASNSPNLFAGQTSLLTLIKREFSGRKSSNQRLTCTADLKTSGPLQATKCILGINLMDIVWDDEPAIAIIARDITQQHKLMSLKIADAQKDEVLATVSHELRTPLNGILGMIQIMEKKIYNAELLNYLSICKNSGTLLVSLVNSILDLNQIRVKKLKLHFEEFDLYNFLTSIVALFEFQCCKKGISLKVMMHPTTPKTMVTDRNRLSQILINLLGNALKFTSKGGITITASKALNDLDHVHFSVEDTGIGIKDEDKAKLFKIFGKLENDKELNHQGVGLGLNISNNLVRALCEREDSKCIKVESEYGKGSKFSFLIQNRKRKMKKIPEEESETVVSQQQLEERTTDLARKLSVYSWKNKASSDVFQRTSVKQKSRETSFVPSLSRSQNPLINHTSPQDGLTNPEVEVSALSISSKGREIEAKPYVLIVDDNPFNVTVAEHMITALGYHVKSALSGEAAVNLLSRNDHRNQPIKMIFMDCQMPVMDGYETTRVLKEKMRKEEIPNIPIIAFTANDSEKDKEKCKKVGMSDYLTKPLNESKLKKIILKYI